MKEKVKEMTNQKKEQPGGVLSAHRNRRIRILPSFALLLFVWVFVQHPEARAQWTTNGNNTTTTNNVGVGTSAPDTRLTVVGPSTSIPTTYNNGDVATFIAPNDSFNAVSIAKGGVTKPPGLDHWSQSSLPLFRNPIGSNGSDH